jgi:tetratricopeptide (TPR) repeat protein
MLEKNIALAFYNKGRMVEALECLDRVLEYWGVRSPKSKIITLLNLIADLLSVVKNLYFPSKRVKKIPENRDVEIINLIERRGAAFAQVDPTRFFMESIGIMRRLNKFDITKVKNGVSIYIASSFLFSITGISFKLSRKILDYTKDYISKDDIRSAFRFRYLELMHNFLKGEWNKEPEYDEVLVDHNTKIGDVFYTSSYTQWNSFLKIGQGNFSGVAALIEKLSEFGESYGHEQAIGRKYSVKSKLLLSCRKLYEAQNEIDEAVIFFNRIGIKLWSIFVLGMKTYVQILLNDIEGAQESLLQTKELVSREKRILPLYINNHLMSQFFFDIYMLNKSINSNDKSVISSLQKKAYRSGKVAINNSMKFAANKIEAFKLMGVYYWLIGKPKKALAWWDKSINAGEQFGARPELARTYMEVGKRLLEKKSKFHQLNGIQAQEYLEKAKVIFQELKLEWDLEELDKIKGRLEHKVQEV